LAGSPAGASITPVSPTTNASGQATFTVSSGSSGTVVFTATDVTDSLVLSNTASVNFEELVVVGPVNAINSTVAASPASVAANGTATSTITVTLKDGSGNLIEGEGVTLGGSPSGTTISPAGAQTTDANGQAAFTVSSTTTGSVVFTATSVTDTVTISQTASVEFTTPVGGSAINVNFYASNGGSYLTPQSDLVGVASTPGEYWNQFNGTSASPLLDASGAASTVAITGLPTTGWGSGTGGYTLLIASRTQFNKGTDTNFTITGLTAEGRYDLYLYSHNQVSTVAERALGTWSTTNTTSGSSSQVIDARTTLNGTTFQEGVNYVKFTDVEADGSGNIAILGDAADVGDFDSLAYRLHLCGIQMVPKDNDYNAWLDSFPGLGAPEDDDDGDGHSNDFERLFGLNPTDPSSANPYTNPYDATTGSFSYSRRTQGLTGWTYRVWYSMNLVDWLEDTLAQQSPTGPANDIEIVDVSIDPDLLTEPKLFVQLRATQEGPPPAAPVLVSSWGSASTASLVFSLAMSESAATNTANYSVVQDGVGPITVTGASLSPDGKTVTLSLSAALLLDTPYTVTANNLTGSNGGVLANGTTGQFQTWDNDPTGIKVFILAGQSNMEGYGSVETGKDAVNGAIGSLRYLAVNNGAYPEYDYTSLLVDPGQPATSAWASRSDVKVWRLKGHPGSSRTLQNGDLNPSFGNQIGPEYGFGQVLGDNFAQPVLLIKCAWGGKSLAVDFRPPGAVAARGGSVGTYYTAIIDDVRDALRNLATDFPEWSGQGYQIAGFGWHQGWADGGNTSWANEYQANLANLIDDLRVEFGSPGLPVSIADSGFYGVGGQTGNLLTVKDAQDAVGSLLSPHPVYAGSVLTGDTAPFWRNSADSPSTIQPHHWNFNGESYFLIGKGLGDDMVDLLTP